MIHLLLTLCLFVATSSTGLTQTLCEDYSDQVQYVNCLVGRAYSEDFEKLPKKVQEKLALIKSQLKAGDLVIKIELVEKDPRHSLSGSSLGEVDGKPAIVLYARVWVEYLKDGILPLKHLDDFMREALLHEILLTESANSNYMTGKASTEEKIRAEAAAAEKIAHYADPLQQAGFWTSRTLQRFARLLESCSGQSPCPAIASQLRRQYQ